MKQMTRYAPYIVIFLFVLITHGLLLLNDGTYWDDWLWLKPDNSINWRSILSAYNEMGFLPTNTIHLWLFNIFGYRVVVFVSIFLFGILVFVLSQELGLGRLEGLFIALISISYPAFQTWIILSTANYVLYYSLFLVGVFLSLKSEKTGGFRHYGFRIGSLVIFFFTFNLNSLLVFYFGFFLLMLIYVKRVHRLSIRQMFSGSRSLPRHLDYVFLPFIFWVIKEVFFPRSGEYTVYHQFVLSPELLVQNTLSFLNNSVYFHLNDAFQRLLSHPMVGLLVLMFAYSTYLLFRVDSILFFSNTRAPYTQITFGIFLLGLGILPYVVVGEAVTVHGWWSRHALLVGLPVAIIILGVTHLAFVQRESGISQLGFSFLVALVLMFSISTIQTYISWQARWVHDRSIMTNLTTMKGFKAFSIFWIDDQYKLGGQGTYASYEWSTIFKRVWGDESHVGIDLAYYPSMADELGTLQNSYSWRSNLSGFDPGGCQATLIIHQGAQAYSEYNLVARYFFYRFLLPQHMQGFLAGVTQVQAQPLSSPSAVNCK